MTCTRKIGPYDCCSVVQGDCLELMKAIPDGALDAVITDPPYGIAHASNYGASWNGTQIANDGDTTVRDAALEVLRGLPMAIFGTWKVAKPQATKAVLIWDKGPASGMGDLAFPWKGSFEEIYILGDEWEGFRDEGVLKGFNIVTWESKGRFHPNAKPVSLMEHIIAKTKGRILDPFCGSGTTLVAAKKLGRHFLGFEISAEYCAIARDRLARIDAQPSLFEPQPEQLTLGGGE